MSQESAESNLNQGPDSPESLGPETVESHSKVEHLKIASNYLRGEIEGELRLSSDSFTEGSVQLLKHHGTYQQDDRDVRAQMRARGEKGKRFMMMLRTRIPGGKLSWQQFLGEMKLSDALGDGSMRLTSRQAVQHHGILKSDLKAAIQRINQLRLDTLGACGDVNRNVMCCPAPGANRYLEEVQGLADRISRHFLPQGGAYFQIWLKDMETGEKESVHQWDSPKPTEEIYGATYLPRKFKIGIGFPHDNCIDLATNDVGLLAIVENESVVGYNVMVGGGMGMTPAKKTTFAALAKDLCFAKPKDVIAVCQAVLEVQRDFGNREDRKHARLKYLVAKIGIDSFREKVAEYFGGPLSPSHDTRITACVDHIGWHQQGTDSNGQPLWYYGLNIPSGRVVDRDGYKMKSALEEVCNVLHPLLRLTAHQSLLICDLSSDQKAELESILEKWEIQNSEGVSPLRRRAISCVAWPTCSLAITESERALPELLSQLDVVLEELGLPDLPLNFRITGCPNGCARPYNAEIALVGKAKEKYTLYLGGSHLGTRLAFVYRDLVPAGMVVAEIRAVLELFSTDRDTGEAFGDFCNRIGKDQLLSSLAVDAG